VEDIIEDMISLRQWYPVAGAKGIKKLFRHERQKEVARRVFKSVIEDYFRLYEPDLLRARKRRRLKRRRFWAAGVNDVWCVDQHDKLKRYGLALHTGIDPFSGKIKWMRVWHSNSNPRLIFRYYLETIKQDGYTSLVTQSDPGTENFNLAKGHSFIRQSLDPDLIGTLQHRFMREKNNLPPEIVWSNLRRNFMPGFEDVLSNPPVSYSPTHPLQYNVFKWIFIPWLQLEIDAYVDRVNSTKKRAQRHKILPHGPADDIDEHPERYNALNFKVLIDPNADYIQEAERLYAPPDHPVFQLVPPEFAYWAQLYYEMISSPPVTRENVWNVYECLLEKFENNAGVYNTLNLSGYEDANAEEDPATFPLTIIDDLISLAYDEESGYMGGVRGGLGLEIHDGDLVDGIVDFSSDGESD
ncbi:hypothetical protein K435DRAFT_703391, partial [Dendrothele bispora CBS 962.96]